MTPATRTITDGLPRRAGATRQWILVLFSCITMAGMTVPALAQVSAPRAPKVSAGPVWADLNPAQKQALAPLAGKWSQISEAQKRKWLALSQNYPQLAPAEQAKLHSRMAEWAALSPQQRSAARLNFADVKKIAPEDRKAQWEAYQSLSAEEKQKLAEGARPKPAGAAIALKPVPPQKITKVQRPRVNPATGTDAAQAQPQLHHSTLLPQSQAAVPDPVQPN